MASKVNERENLVKEISKIKKNIRQKHYALTQDIMNVEQQMEKSLKPITEPLKLLIEKEKKPKAIEKKINDSQDIEMDDIEQRMKNKRAHEDSVLHESEKIKRPVIEEPNNDSVMFTEEIPIVNEETVYESPPSVQEALSTSDERIRVDYIDNLFKGNLVRRYMQTFFNDVKHEIDHVFGPYYNDNEILMVGKEPITFDDDDIVINNNTYGGTPGLYELLFMKNPDSYTYTQEDLQSYADILKTTKAHIHLPSGRIKSSKSAKYNKIIKPALKSFKLQQYWWDHMDGRGMMKVTNTKPNYIYWDNVNELCDRLRLLIASQNAGHTGHDNEILSIIEELHEAGIINESASMVRYTFGK